MGLLRKFADMLGVIGRMLGLLEADAPARIAPHTSEPFAAVVPAVAGFVWRVAVDRFMLARRLASIARLNTPVGRKPRGLPRRSQGLPPIPAARLGAKKTRLGANSGTRVLRATPSVTTIGSNVIPFPARRTNTIARVSSLARAA